MKDNNEVDFFEIFKVFWEEKVVIALIAVIFSIITFVYALSLNNIYTSKAILSPVEDSSRSLSGPYSSIASFAGINLSGSSANTTDEALKILESLKFFEESFLPNINASNLLATSSWNEETKQIIYTQQAETASSEFSVIRAHRIFINDHLYVEKNARNNFVTISIQHISPVIAKDWVNIIVKKLNQRLREDKKSRTSLSLDYLYGQLENTKLNEVKVAISRLVEQLTEQMMLIESSEDYVFKVLDPPYVPEKKTKPQRSVLILLGSLVGVLIGMLTVLVKKYYYRRS